MKTTFKNLFHNLIQNITNLEIFMTWPTRRCYLFDPFCSLKFFHFFLGMFSSKYF